MRDSGVLSFVRDLGFAVSIRRVEKYVEIRADSLPVGEPVYIARVEGDSNFAFWQCECELGEMVTRDLKK